MTQEQIPENDEGLSLLERFRQQTANKKLTFNKTVMTKYEGLCHTAAGKRGLTAHQVADIICQDNPELLKIKELIEVLKAWDTDRNDLKNYRKRERMAKKTTPV